MSCRFEFVGNGITKDTVDLRTFVLKIIMWGSMHLLSPVVTRMDSSKSGWTPYVYYRTLYSTPRYTIFRRKLLGMRTFRKVGKSE